MTIEHLTQFSESLADAVAAAAPSVVQVHGAGRPAIAGKLGAMNRTDAVRRAIRRGIVAI